MTGPRADARGSVFSDARSKRWLALVLTLFVGLSLYGIGWGLPNFESWSNDDDTPVGSLSAGADLFQRFDKYPPVSHLANLAVYSPYVAYLWWTDQLVLGRRDYPYGFSDPIHQMTVLMVLSRLLSAAAAAVTVYCVYRLTVALGFSRGAGILASALAATSHEVVLFAHTGNVESLLNLFFALCLLSAVRAGSEGKRPYVLLGVWAALALATKESIWGALLGVACFVVASVVRSSGLKLKAILDRRLGLALAAFAGTYVCFGTAFAFRVYWYRILHWIDHAGEMAEIKAQFTPVDVLWRTIREMEMGTTALHLLAMAAGSVLLWRLRRRAVWFLAAPVVAYYLTVLAPVKLVWARYTIPIILCGSVAGGAFFAWLYRASAWSRVLASLLVILTLGYGATRCLASDRLMTRDSRYEAERWLLQHVPREARIEYYGASSYFPRFRYLGYSAVEIPPEGMNPAALRLRSPSLIVVSSNALYRYGSDQGSTQARAYIRDLLDGRTDYVVAARIRTSVPFQRNNRFPWDVHSRISPTIILLQRASPVGAAGGPASTRFSFPMVRGADPTELPARRPKKAVDAG